MLVIVNVSPKGMPEIGRNKYEVRINRRVIATFEHDRQPGGAAQCLRDAADAVDRCSEAKKVEMIMALLAKD